MFLEPARTKLQVYAFSKRLAFNEIDTALDITSDPDHCDKEEMQMPGENMIHCFKYLTGHINS